MMNGFDLTPPTRTQTPEQEYNDLYIRSTPSSRGY